MSIDPPPCEAPRAGGEPPLKAVLRETNQDFRVSERLGFALEGEGPHLFVEIEKDGVNTLAVREALARSTGLRPMNVGYSGLKDRHAVTTQWFSLPLNQDPDPAQLAGEGFHVIDTVRHRRKLRIGSHAGNRFVLTLRAVSGDTDRLDEVLERVGRDGVPNYFGAQRFGRGADNLRRAHELFVGGASLGRRQRSFAVSAARSWLFNRVLAERVRGQCWNRFVPGDLASLAGSRSYFDIATESDRALLDRRLAGGDIHPSGPLWGAGESPASADAAELEQRVAEALGWAAAGLATAGLRHERRALRLAVEDLAWQRSGDTLTLRFELPRGAFATALIHEVADCGESLALA